MKKKTVEGPLGFPMPETLARDVESLIKSLPKGNDYRYRKAASVPSSVELIKGEKADISLISSEAIDREREVVLAKGMDLQMFQKNPIVTFAHKYDELPVGKAQWIRRVEGGIKAKTQYTTATDLARACWQMTQEGILKGKSIGFLPTKLRPPSPDEPHWKNANVIIESAVMIEYAVATIPVNQDALVEAVAKGMTDHATLKRLGFTIEEPKRNDLEILLKALTAVRVDPRRLADLITTQMKQRGRV